MVYRKSGEFPHSHSYFTFPEGITRVFWSASFTEAQSSAQELDGSKNEWGWSKSKLGAAPGKITLGVILLGFSKDNPETVGIKNW